MKEVISVNLDKEVVQAAKTMAKEEGRNLSNYINRLLQLTFWPGRYKKVPTVKRRNRRNGG